MYCLQYSVTIAVVLLGSAGQSCGETSDDSINHLNRYRGDWMINGSRKHLLHVVKTDDRKIETRSWVLGNSGQKIGRRETMTYDAARKTYAATIRYTNGKSWEAKGEWDAATKTLKWIAPTKEGERHFALRFQNERKHVFTIKEFDRNGKPGWSYREERFRLGD